MSVSERVAGRLTMDERDDGKRPEGGGAPQGTGRRGNSLSAPPPAGDDPVDGGQSPGPRLSGNGTAPSPVSERSHAERRGGAALRRRTLLSAKIVFHDRQAVLNCMIRDMSENGAKLIFGVVPSCPKSFDLVMSSGAVRRCEIAYRRENTIGVRFLGLE
jgi:hypothetical protein